MHKGRRCRTRGGSPGTGPVLGGVMAGDAAPHAGMDERLQQLRDLRCKSSAN